MKDMILKGWGFFRMIRLVAGVAITAQGLYLHEWPFIIAGVIFLILAIFNQGCCAGNSCNMPGVNSNSNMDDTSFEEVV